VWRTTVQGGPLFQVTGHRSDHVTWPSSSRDGNVLVYEHDFDLYAIDLAKPVPRKLSITTSYRYEDPVGTETLAAGFQAPAWSPSGAQLVFASRGDLWIASIEGGDARPLTRGVMDDRDPAWTADGKEVVYVTSPVGMPGQAVRISVSGGEPRPITREEGAYRSPRLSPRGELLLVARTEGSETDLLLVDARTGEAKPFASAKGADELFGAFSSDGKQIAYLSTRQGRTELLVRGLDEGAARTLKTEPSLKFGLDWSPDGKRLAYTVRPQSGAPFVRVLEIESGRETPAAAGAQRPSWSPDSTMLLCEEPSGESTKLTIRDAGGGQRLPVPVKAARTMARSEEMRGVFQQVWSSYYNNYYDPFFHGVDMPALREKYAGLAAACRTKPELYDLINEMIRELRSSHIHLKPAPVRNSASTGSLAADLGPDGRVLRVEPGGPAAKSGIREGERIILAPGEDLDRVLAGLAEARLRVRDAGGVEREVAVKGVDRSTLRQLKYENWVERNRKLVKERSGGRLAYFHIRMMVQSEVTRLREALEGDCKEAEALVFDERDGQGGLAHRPVCALLDSTAQERLNRSPACWTRNRNGTSSPDRYGGGRAASKSWDKPVIMIQNEISRSDKEILPYTFRHLGIGYLVGMPTAGGVIGGSEWTMQDGSRIVVSVQGWFTAEGRNMEGWGVPPDYRVPMTHEDLIAGRDPQIEKAVDVLLAQMDGRIPAPRKPGGDKIEGK
jgi:C-terminal processing protease CtpA/Prc